MNDISPAIPIRFGLMASLVWAMSFLGYGQDDDAEAMLPVSPSSLWEVLPGNLRTWELKKSTAELRFRSWPEARAVREYEKREPEQEGESKSGPPMTTRLTITDTGAYPGKLDFFDDFETGKDEEEERARLDGYPAFLFPLEKGGLGVEMRVGDRFLIEIMMWNQPRTYLREWLGRIDLRALAAISETESVPLPETLRIYQLDQLNPNNNSGYRMATTTSSRQSQQAHEDEAWLQGLIDGIPGLEEPDAEPEPGEASASKSEES